jgi:prepilin-type processing-associated H-X9-DG protein
MMLSRLERQDIWDQLIDAEMIVPINFVESFVCPSDTDVQSRSNLGALSYSANTGAWDYDDSFNFLVPTQSKPRQGDVAANGVFFNLAEGKVKSRIGAIKDPTNMTILFTENIHKDYDTPLDNSSNGITLTWLAGTEQQLGVVWVVPPNPPSNSPPVPTAGNGIDQQEAINRIDPAITAYNPEIPRFARPASAHGEGAVVAFCDGHVEFLRDTIDYITYQRLMTATGRKCVNPEDWDDKLGTDQTMYLFQRAAPLSEKDFR